MQARAIFCAAWVAIVAACTGCSQPAEQPLFFVDDAGAKVCPSKPGAPEMVAVGAFGGAAYCVDKTEVTNAHYAAWLKTGPDLSGQRSDCAANTSYASSAGMPPENDAPVVNVDFCDALAFCAAFGKRLCGRVGGGPSEFYAKGDAAVSQWFSACSHGGPRLFPYGSTYDPNACNGSGALFGVTVAAGSLPSCMGGFEGIFDMSGNVWEWEDACIPGDAGTPVCRRRGGSFSSSEKYLSCDAPSSREIFEVEDNTGFRCCAD